MISIEIGKIILEICMVNLEIGMVSLNGRAN